MKTACRTYFSAIPVLTDLNAPDGYGLDDRYNAVSLSFRKAGAACLGGNEKACAAIQQAAVAWATQSKGLRPAGVINSPKYWNDTLTINMRLLAPMTTMLAVAQVVAPMESDDRATVDAWLRGMLGRFSHGMRQDGYYKGGSDGTTARRAAHNHATQSSIAAMSYGAWAGDDTYFRTGLEQWSITLNSMRDDGSLPIETRRGARALFYHGRTISALIQIAERARVQGIDLYGRTPANAGSIHHAVNFFLDAVLDPSIVLPYARSNKAPGPSKDYTRQDLGGGGTLGWIAPYMTRFPNHPNTHRLRAISGKETYLTPHLASVVQNYGGSNEWIGVDTRCFYAKPQ
jgi:poly(beta-D-mannuronate) lyase